MEPVRLTNAVTDLSKGGGRTAEKDLDNVLVGTEAGMEVGQAVAH